mgnify:CR=1 FL=1
MNKSSLKYINVITLGLQTPILIKTTFYDTKKIYVAQK